MGGDDLGSDDEFFTSARPPPRKKSKTDSGGAVEHIAGEAANLGAIQQRGAGSEPKSRKQDKLGFLDPPDHLAATIQTAVNEFTKLHDLPMASISVLPSFFLSSHKETLLDRLKDVTSTKVMKNWKHQGSPCVVIVCISARRATEILKDLAPLKMRMAKLFPKSGSVKEQLQLLTTPFGVAVGTPNRIHALAEKSETILLSKTHVVIFDSQISHKAYTVCTLPDTAPDCMRFLVEHVLPQLQVRKDLKLAFL